MYWRALLRALEPLRHRGLRVAVDGSRSGFTPAERILSLRPDIIKLDRTFIDGILEGSDQHEPAVIGLAREVGAVLAAEGIETEAELEAITRAGLTAGQGYLLGRPSVHPLDWSSWVIQTTVGPPPSHSGCRVVPDQSPVGKRSSVSAWVGPATAAGAQETRFVLYFSNWRMARWGRIEESAGDQ